MTWGSGKSKAFQVRLAWAPIPELTFLTSCRLALIKLDRVPDSEPHHPHLHSRERHLPVLMRVKEQGTRIETTEMKHLGTAKMNKEFLLTPRIPCHR